MENSVLQYIMVFAWMRYRRFRDDCLFQFMGIAWPVWAIMSLAIFNGLMTSIILETLFVKADRLKLRLELRLACHDFHDWYRRNECH